MQTLLQFVMIVGPLLLASPSVFLIRQVRERAGLRVAALTVVGGSYLLLLLVAVPAIVGGWIMLEADNPANNFVSHVIDRDQMFGRIRFPEGSTVTRLYGKITSILLSKDLEIEGIPARKGTTVDFDDDGTVGSLTTGRAWTYRGILIPPGSTVFMKTRSCIPATPSQGTARVIKGWACGIYSIDISQRPDATLDIEGMLVYGAAVLNFRGDTLTSLAGYYSWNGGIYKSYSVDAHGQVTRQLYGQPGLHRGNFSR